MRIIWVAVLGIGLGIGCVGEDYTVSTTDEAVDPSAPLPLHVISLSPTEGSSSATPLSTISIEFSQPIDPDTVEQSTVALLDRDSIRRVPATLEVASNGTTVTLSPLRPLTTHKKYTVVVIGVATAQGEEATYSAAFYTKAHYHSVFSQYNQDGVLGRFNTSSFDSDLGVRSVDYGTPGIDGIMGSDDDIVGTHTEYYFNAFHDNDYVLVRTGPNPDDSDAYERHLAWGNQGLQSRYRSNAGDNGNLGDGDDYDEHLTQYFYDSLDRPTGKCSDDAGLDLLAHTEDDERQGCTRILYWNNKELHIRIVAPGPDGAWRTADDTIGSEFSLFLRDQTGLVALHTRFEFELGSAPTLLGYTTYQYDADGLPNEATEYSGAGLDGFWGSGDDEEAMRIESTHDNQGLLQSTRIYKPQSDNQADYLYRQYMY